MITATITIGGMIRGMIMSDAFLLRVALAGLGVALAAGPLGCFVLWRRMVYFGDTVSHAALLGVALALALNLPVFWGVLVCALIIAGVVAMASGRLHHADTLLGVAAHSALALGLVAVGLQAGGQVDLMSYLIGDILAVNWRDVAVIWGGGGLVAGLLVLRWNALLAASLNRELALSLGVNPRRESLLFTLSLAVLVAVAIKVVGALLITAMLIIPASSARLTATTPERMAVLAALFGAGSVVLGLAGSLRFDSPTGPSIIVAALVLLLGTGLLRRLGWLRPNG